MGGVAGPVRSGRVGTTFEGDAEMLNDLVISRAAMGNRHVDMHSYATFSCGISHLFRRIVALFR